MSGHTKRSASSAERWMNCPGSAAIDDKFSLSDEDDETDFAAEGTAAHEAAAYCLANGLEPWEIVGMEFHAHTVTAEMADHIRMYTDYVRKSTSGERFIEYKINDPSLHPEFGGTADVFDYHAGILTIIDLKYGAGIAKDAVKNPQLMYYGFGAIFGVDLKLWQKREAIKVKLVIVQPRAFHLEGPIREWEINGAELYDWGVNELLPAMHAADHPAPEGSLIPGSWCRFCPARAYCPALQGAFAAMVAASLDDARKLTDEELALEKEAGEVVKTRMKAIDDEVFKRLNAGSKIPGWALGPKKSDRIFKDSLPQEGTDVRLKLEDAARAKFGGDAFSPPKLLTPPNIAKLPGGADFVALWAYKPDNGLTVVPDDGSKSTINVLPIADRYASILGKS